MKVPSLLEMTCSQELLGLHQQ